MAIDSRPSRPPTGSADRGRPRLRFRAEQVIRMVEAGIIPAGVELWDGVISRLVKGEAHNYVTSQVADALRAVIPGGYHVREEKSCADGERSLPEPDVAVCRGRKGDSLPDPPPIDRLALVVEVDHHTHRADAVVKPRRYAEVGIPVFWRVDVRARTVVVHQAPEGTGDGARYASTRVATESDPALPIVVDGREVGSIAVADLFPPATSARETPP